MTDPVLVDRAEAVAVSTFDRLYREGRFEDAVIIGGRQPLYRVQRLRDHISARSAAMRQATKSEAVTIAISPANEINDFRRTHEPLDGV